MTKLEKRQMLLMDRYQKQGIYQFVLIKGTLSGMAFMLIVFLNEDPLPLKPWYLNLFAALVIGWIFGIGLWFFALWYFAKIKKGLSA